MEGAFLLCNTTTTLARCPRLLALDVVYGKLTEEADNILIKGTSLEGDRESEEQRSKDRARRMDLAKLRKGNVLEAGPQICVVHLRLDSFWVFSMVPYQSGPVASSVNGVWDEAWRTWARVAEFSLGEECEIVPAVEMILKVVRKTSVSGHHQWPDQARCRDATTRASRCGSSHETTAPTVRAACPTNRLCFKLFSLRIT